MTERARIRRGTTPRHKRPAIVRRSGASAAPARPGAASRALATIPVAESTLRDFARKTGVAIAGVAIVVGLFMAHVPQMVGTGLGEMVGMAGLSVKHVEIQGIRRMDRLPVYSVALDQTSTAMPLVDLEAIRQKLLKFGWVADARVSRRLPDTLLVDIVERVPAAIWQYQGKLNLIDKDGVALAPVDQRSMPDLPIVVGPDANVHAAELAALLAVAPRLKPMIASANWIGDRRWDIHFSTGEGLALPEGDDAASALRFFELSDRTRPLLGQGYVHFDMRLYDRNHYSARGLVVRLSRRPGYEVGDGAASPGGTAPAGTDAI
ncbi:MAG TPA: FtsQ-type POTRA domain-containing protein [Sphingomonas sp.]